MTKKLGAWPVSEFNKFYGLVQRKVHHVVVAEEKSNTISEEKLLISENVTPSEEFDKGTNILNDME